MRWRLPLKDYQITYKYKKGKLKRGVEALSRNPEGWEELSETSDLEKKTETKLNDPKKENATNRALFIHDRSHKVLPTSRSQGTLPESEKPVDNKEYALRTFPRIQRFLSERVVGVRRLTPTKPATAISKVLKRPDFLIQRIKGLN